MMITAQAPGGAGVLDNLAQYGVLGVLAIILIYFANNAYKREMARADNAEKEVARLNSVIADKVVPALLTASHALSDSQSVIRELTEEREREARVIRSRVQQLEEDGGGGRSG